ncbi:MAG: hypothetical protein ACOCQ4_01785 [bacterium]
MSNKNRFFINLDNKFQFFSAIIGRSTYEYYLKRKQSKHLRIFTGLMSGIAIFFTGLIFMFTPISSTVFYIIAAVFWIIVIAALIWGDK